MLEPRNFRVYFAVLYGAYMVTSGGRMIAGAVAELRSRAPVVDIQPEPAKPADEAPAGEVPAPA